MKIKKRSWLRKEIWPKIQILKLKQNIYTGLNYFNKIEQQSRKNNTNKQLNTEQQYRILMNNNNDKKCNL